MENESKLGAYAAPLLFALVLFVVCRKLCVFLDQIDSPLSPAERTDLAAGLLHLRDLIAQRCDSDRFASLVDAVKVHGRLSAIFTSGIEPEDTDMRYRPLSSSPTHRIAIDPSLPTGGVRELAAAMAVLGLGVHDGDWWITTPTIAPGCEGSLHVHSGGTASKIFFFASSSSAIHLRELGGFDPDDASNIAIFSGDPPSTATRAPSSSPGRTGRTGAREVHMRDLLRAAANNLDLRQQFREASLL